MLKRGGTRTLGQILKKHLSFRLFKTPIDNIQLSVNGTGANHPAPFARDLVHTSKATDGFLPLVSPPTAL